MSSPAVNQSGALSINTMTQQGMQALSKILKGPLLDQKRINMDQATMQVLLGQGQKGIAREHGLNSTNELNYDQCSIDDTIPPDQIVVETRRTGMDDLVDDPELHLDDEEGEIIFDCGTQELTGSPDKIGEHITQMLESVLPNGIQNGTDGRLRAVVNGDELNITEESLIDFKEAMSSLGQIQMMQHHQHSPKLEIEQITAENDCNYDGCPQQPSASRLRPQSSPSHDRHPSRAETSKKKTSGHLGYEYPLTQPRRAPNFTALMGEKRPLCLFCEYYLVFGEPPRNMIKWYNRNYEYDDIPRADDKMQHKNRRKRNR